MRQDVCEYASTTARSRPRCSAVRSESQTCACTVAHDFAVGTRTELFAFGEHLDDKFRINLIGMIGLVCEEHSIKIFKTVARFKHELGFTWRRDERHVNDFLTLLNPEGSKASETLCTKDTVKTS